MQFTSENVQQVYTGKDGKCCCGCSGRHRLNPKHHKLGETHHGYTVTKTELSLLMVNRVCEMLNTHPDLLVKNSDDCYSVSLGEKIYIAYLVGAK
jgi:hypothetical protein